MGNPELLLLDEPSEGLAPLVVETLLDKIRELKAQGLTILLAEQGVDFSLALADRVYVLEKGSIRHAARAANCATIRRYAIDFWRSSSLSDLRKNRKILAFRFVPASGVVIIV